MTAGSVIHDTFTFERSFLATPARAFAAFASAEAKKHWFGPPDPAEFDFRVGGHERFRYRHQGKPYRYDARYYDIVPDERIVYSYEIYMDEARMSVSVTTIEFARSGDGTGLIWTEQGAFLDGVDGPRAPAERMEGTAIIVDDLAGYLQASGT